MGLKQGNSCAIGFDRDSRSGAPRRVAGEQRQPPGAVEHQRAIAPKLSLGDGDPTRGFQLRQQLVADALDLSGASGGVIAREAPVGQEGQLCLSTVVI